MFRRRKQQPVHHKVGNLIWPQIGFRRSVTYIWHRIARIRGTPHGIAGGFAAGAAISFTPFVGAHLLLAALVAWMTRSNVVAGLLGTAVGNPWTFPFIWVWIYKLGRRLGAGRELGIEPDFVAIVADLPGAARAAIGFDLDTVYFDNVWAVVWPMMVGGIPSFLLVWLASYLFFKPLVAAYQVNRITRRRRKQQRLRAVAHKRVDVEPPGDDDDDLQTLPAANGAVAEEARG